jgi:Bacterial PH domain
MVDLLDDGPGAGRSALTDRRTSDRWHAGAVQWSPRAAETVALLVLGVGLALAVVFLDAAGRVLVGAGALLVLGLAVRDLLTRPRLTAGPDGVDVRGLTGGVHLPWARLRVRVRETRRLGMRSRTLELDTAAGPDDDGVLVVLGRRDLGADPDAVARTLRGLDPTAV